jgi:hypothetical protein
MFFLFDHAEEIRNFLLRIGQQRKGQTELILKFLLRGCRIGRDSEQHHACFPDLRVAVTEAAGLLGASRSIGFGIEIKDDGLAAKVFQGNLFAILVRRTEVWGFIIDVDFHGIFSSPARCLHRKLYRNRRFAVMLAALMLLSGSWLAAQILEPQYGRKQERDKGPRALGLIQLAPKGKGRLVPIAIMMDGKFYDAGAFKADPVPMALDFGVVYEAFRSGVSQGVFTITQPGQLNHVWIAEGTWIPAGSKALEKHKKYSTPVIEDEDKGGPPVLHRRAEKTDSDGDSKSDSGGKDTNASTNTNTSTNKDPQKPGPAATPTTTAPAGAPDSPDNAKASRAPDATKAPPTQETAKASAPASTDEEPNEDPNRPRLRRGKPDATTHSDPYATFQALPEATPKAAASLSSKPDAKANAATAPQIVTIPAISDAGGPDPRPYVYDVKPAEEAIYRSKMLDLAATQVRAPARCGGESCCSRA